MGTAYSGNVVPGGAPEDDTVIARRMILAKLRTAVHEAGERTTRLEQQLQGARNRLAAAHDKAVALADTNALLEQKAARLQRSVDMGDRRCSDILQQLDEAHQHLVHTKSDITRLSEKNAAQDHLIHTLRKEVHALTKKVDLVNQLVAEKDRLLTQ